MIAINKANLKVLEEAGKTAEILSKINESISKDTFDVQDIDRYIDNIPKGYKGFANTIKLMAGKNVEKTLYAFTSLKSVRLVKDIERDKIKFNDIKKVLVSYKISPSCIDMLLRDAIDFFIGFLTTEIAKMISSSIAAAAYPKSPTTAPMFGDIGMYDGDVLPSSTIFSRKYAFPNMFTPMQTTNPMFPSMSSNIGNCKQRPDGIYNPFTDSYECVDSDLSRYLDPVHRIEDDDDDDSDDEDDVWVKSNIKKFN